MKAALVLLGLIAACSALAPLYNTGNKLIPSQYIVKFIDGVQTADHFRHLESKIKANPENIILHRYSIGTFQGYALRCTDDLLTFIRSQEEVYFVEQDSYVAALATQTNPPSWGLDRVDQRNLPLNQRYIYSNQAGQNINMYTVDTGIYIAHNDFGGRARWGITVPSGASDADNNGHGTHCSGTMAGTSYGIAKQASLFAVKVLNDLGFGTNSDVIAGVNYVADQYRTTGRTTVANMSLGGGFSAALNNAVDAAVSAGSHFAVAAGNDNANACNYSPASAPLAVTVCATESSDSRASYTNWGTCVDICAPGTSITSAWIGTANASRSISGTSMASPHVAGVMALWLSVQNQTPAALSARLGTSSTKNVITGLPAGTVNYLLYNDPPSA